MKMAYFLLILQHEMIGLIQHMRERGHEPIF